jgi:pimeloyl-ACP methyl ester carboxylesterase
MMKRYLAALLAVAMLQGCAIFASRPMDVLMYENPQKEKTGQRLIVFMRGFGGSHHSFEEEGLVADVWACGLSCDIVAPNAHFGYYGSRSLIDRLKKDVIDPARARAVKEIWLVGFSMGGLGSLLYFMEHPEDITRVYLIAPYLGSTAFLGEIQKAGGVRLWEPGDYTAELDWQRMLWHWLKESIAGHPGKMIYLGYGRSDPYATWHGMLAGLLVPKRVHVIDGGHDYETFKTLWKNMLANDSP